MISPCKYFLPVYYKRPYLPDLLHSNGGHFEFLPVTIQSGGVVLAILRVGAQVGFELAHHISVCSTLQTLSVPVSSPEFS